MMSETEGDLFAGQINRISLKSQYQKRIFAYPQIQPPKFNFKIFLNHSRHPLRPLLVVFTIIIITMQLDDDSRAHTAATKIQSLIRGVLTRSQVSRKVKDFFKRKMIIKQLLDTEQSYIRDLSIVISDFQTPMLNRKIITREEALTIFMNIDQIRKLNELFFVTIFEQARDYWHFKVIFEQVEKQVHFFKMYFEYLNNYTTSSTLIDELMERRAFAEFVDEAKLQPSHRLLSLKDYLIKPVQRLPKYVLIMKEIKKRTPSDHPDYANICRVLRLFEEVNFSNNEKLNRVVNGYKITEIEKKLMLPHVISEAGVEFVLEEPVTVISNDVQVIQGTLYLLNTELIVARRLQDGKERFMVSIPFKNGGGSIMSNEEHYFYRNSFTVQNGEGDSCTFLCQGQQEKQMLIQKIYNQLMRAQQRTLEKLSALCNVKSKEGVEFLRKMTRLDLLPDVEILGTDERSDNMFKYTVYIVEIRIKAIKQKIFLRYRELLELQEDLGRQYGINLKNGLAKTTWVTNHKPRRIEERKMAIQRFLKELLSKQEIIQHGSDILHRLGLPPDLYKLPDIYKESEDILKRSSFQRSTSDIDEEPEYRSILKQKRGSIFDVLPELQPQREERPRPRSKRISIQQILKANELHLGHFTRYTQIMQPKGLRQPLKIDVLIPWIQNEKGFVKQTITMDREDRVLCLIEQLANKIGLKYFKDFRLMLERQFAGRMLDDDQCLPKVLQEMRTGKYLLILKKMIYVTQDIQQCEIRRDRVRLKVIASQVVYDCRKDKYLLDYSALLRIAALVGIAQLFANQDEKDDGQIKDALNGDLPLRTRSMITNTYTSFYDGDSTWCADYKKIFEVLLQKLQAVGDTNRVTFRTSGIADVQREYNTTQVGQLAATSIIAQMRGNIFFGSISFVVQISQWFRQFLIRFGEEEEDSYDNRNCWLVIKYDSLHLYSISLRTRIFSANYNELYKIQPSPSSMILWLRDRQIEYLKLKTTNSYSIRELLLYYKNYNDIVKKMDQDTAFEQSMIELVRQHTRQSRQTNH